MPTPDAAVTDQIPSPIRQVRDTEHTALIASQWKLTNATDQHRAAHAALEAMPVTTPGLVNYSVYRGLDDFSLFHLSQWTTTVSRDRYVDVSSAGPRDAVDSELPDIDRRWREFVSPHRRYVSGDPRPPRCLVVVRQPLRLTDPVIVKEWVDTVVTALESGTRGTDVLIATTVLINSAGDVALNLAEWVSADAHRNALRPADLGTTGNGGDSPRRQATREHSEVNPEYEALRYTLVGAVSGLSN